MRCSTRWPPPTSRPGCRTRDAAHRLAIDAQAISDAHARRWPRAGVGSPRASTPNCWPRTSPVSTAADSRSIEPDADFVDRYRTARRQACRRIPLQHLTGTAAFGPVTVHVGPGVFIPRPETESLLEWALAQPLSAAPADRRPVHRLRCAGGRAGRHRPGARVVAVDDSADALAYARRNVRDTAVELVRADVTDAGLLTELDGTVDLLVANPPYIPDGAQLEPEVAEHDPPHALFGGPDGMAVIDRIVALAARLLRPGGRFAVEHDDTTSGRTVEAFTRTGRSSR